MSVETFFTILTLLVLAMVPIVSAQSVEPVYSPGDFFNYEYTTSFSQGNRFCTVKVFLTVRVTSVNYPLVEYSVGDYRKISLTGDCEVFGLTLELLENSFREDTGIDRLNVDPSPSYIGFFANPSYTGEFSHSYQLNTGVSNGSAKYVNGVLTRYVERTDAFFSNSVSILELLSTNVYYKVNPYLVSMSTAAGTISLILGSIMISRTVRIRALSELREHF